MSDEVFLSVRQLAPIIGFSRAKTAALLVKYKVPIFEGKYNRHQVIDIFNRNAIRPKPSLVDSKLRNISGLVNN